MTTKEQILGLCDAARDAIGPVEGESYEVQQQKRDARGCIMSIEAVAEGMANPAADVGRLKASVEELGQCLEAFIGMASEVDAYVDNDTSEAYGSLCQAARSALARTAAGQEVGK